MPASIKITAVQEIDGRLYVDFDDSEQLEFSSVEQCKESHADLLDERAALQYAKRMLIARGLRALNTPGHDLQTMVGKTATYARKQAAGNILRVV